MARSPALAVAPENKWYSSFLLLFFAFFLAIIISVSSDGSQSVTTVYTYFTFFSLWEEESARTIWACSGCRRLQRTGRREQTTHTTAHSNAHKFKTDTKILLRGVGSKERVDVNRQHTPQRTPTRTSSRQLQRSCCAKSYRQLSHIFPSYYHAFHLL